MADLGLCGLVIVIFLFLLPASIYLAYGMECFTVDIYNENYAIFCKNISPDMAFILTVFGFIFLVCGITMIGFTALVWWHDKNSTNSQKSEDAVRFQI